MAGTENKSWKKINEERKSLKRQHKQEKLLKQLEKNKKLELSESITIKNDEKESAAVALESKPPNSTLTIAVPGSILENAQSVELRTYLAGQIARAACIFRVDEIVIFDDIGISNAKQAKGTNIDSDDKNVRSSCLQLARILQYLECPQYLRKFFFPIHNDLKYSGLLNPLDAPHHLRKSNTFMYREGIVTDKLTKDQKNCFVNIGLQNEILINKSLSPGIRVTVKINNYNNQQTTKKLRGTVVAPNEPRNKTGIYWGYSVRIAHSISEIFTKSPYENGYDLSIGTSDKGSNIYDIEKKSLSYNHALIVFGGLKGLETVLEIDEQLNVDAKFLFDHYLNVVPIQGSRTIRTEEALLITLSVMQEKLNPIVPDIEFVYKECIAQSEDTGGHIIENSSNSKIDTDLKRFD